MTPDPPGDSPPDPPADSLDDPPAEWPVPLRGVTESVVATRGPGGRWNLAALGVQVGDHAAVEDRVTARTWGRTRTRRNFDREGEGVVQFVDDPLVFVEAALGIYERADPVDPSAAAWVRVDVERVGTGESGGTGWADWVLSPREASVDRETVPTINRGYNAVIEATVAASRLAVPAYDPDELLDRLAYLERVVEAAGDARDREAFDRVDDLVEWRDRR